MHGKIYKFLPDTTYPQKSPEKNKYFYLEEKAFSNKVGTLIKSLKI